MFVTEKKTWNTYINKLNSQLSITNSYSRKNKEKH